MARGSQWGLQCPTLKHSSSASRQLFIRPAVVSGLPIGHRGVQRRSEKSRCHYGEMAAVGNSCCRGGLGCGCVAETRATVRAASDGDSLRGCAEEQRVMATSAVASCSCRGEKESEEAAAVVKVARKRRRQRLTMGDSGSWRPEPAAAAVKKVSDWMRLRVDCDSRK
ncbi:hypothetical protein BHM03_00013261 [Ensete ventricosum]|uniref:Uncharacterized protein n=1 Tax=Ensete ventricosum TaxID=4639 RepID=A0A445MDX8_ENSVE|nr:hypothetical protein BHM03_00013261 [Ensete ventricosum]